MQKVGAIFMREFDNLSNEQHFVPFISLSLFYRLDGNCANQICLPEIWALLIFHTSAFLGR